MLRVVAWSLAMLVAASGCKESSSLFCEMNPTDPRCGGLGVDAGGECTTNAECQAPTGVCDTGHSSCVQCTVTDTTACSGTAPVCGVDEACHGCTAHTDCASAACLPDGSCAAETDVAYVDPAGTDNAVCSQSMPCTVVAKALAASRRFVKFHGKTAEQVSLTNVVVTWLADPGASLTLPSDGPLVLLMGTTNLQIYDLELRGAASASIGTGVGISMPGNSATLALTRATVAGHLMGGLTATESAIAISQSTFSENLGGALNASSSTVSVSGSTFTDNQDGAVTAVGSTVIVTKSTFSGNQGGALIASSASHLTVDGSTISGNDLGLVDHNGTVTISRSIFSGNTGGGIALTNDTFTVTGNVLFSNGGPTTNSGGVGIASTAPDNSTNRLEFNSFSKNLSKTGVGPGIQCAASGFTARNNIVSDNGSSTQLDQVGGSCAYAYSIVRPGTLPAGTGNLAVAPMFVNEPTGDLHIEEASPARGAADPAAVLTGFAATDIDGDPRIAPADIGADQFKP